jgi:hypothetical protein
MSQIGNTPSIPASGFQIQYLWGTRRSLPELALERDGSAALIRRYTYGSMRRTTFRLRWIGPLDSTRLGFRPGVEARTVPVGPRH